MLVIDWALKLSIFIIRSIYVQIPKYSVKFCQLSNQTLPTLSTYKKTNNKVLYEGSTPPKNIKDLRTKMSKIEFMEDEIENKS